MRGARGRGGARGLTIAGRAAPRQRLTKARPFAPKFSEVVRRAQAEGPQYVTVRGKPSVAVIDASDLERLLPAQKSRLPLVPFMESLYVEGLDLERGIDRGRDVEL